MLFLNDRMQNTDHDGAILVEHEVSPAESYEPVENAPNSGVQNTLESEVENAQKSEVQNTPEPEIENTAEPSLENPAEQQIENTPTSPATLTLENIHTSINESTTQAFVEEDLRHCDSNGNTNKPPATSTPNGSPSPRITPSSASTPSSVTTPVSLADKSVAFNPVTGEPRVIINTADASTLEAQPGDRLVKQRDLKYLLGFSLLAALMFFPTGLIAVYYAILTRRTFNAGYTVGNFLLAKRYSRLCEKLVIISLVLGLFSLVVFAIVEKDQTHHRYHMQPGHY